MLSAHEVTTAYQGLVAISSVSIEVTKGEIVCVAGANGAGKSTLLKSIAGAERPRSGAITFDGARIDGDVRAVQMQYADHIVAATRHQCGVVIDEDYGTGKRLGIAQVDLARGRQLPVLHRED